MKIRFGAGILILAAILLSHGAAAADVAKTRKVVFTISHQQNEYVVQMGKNFVEVGKQCGFDVQLMDANFDPAKQISQIESAIAQKADAIIVEPTSFDGLTTGVKEAIDARIPLITVHGEVSCQDLLPAYVAVDLKGGELKTARMALDLNGKGNIGLMLGTLGQHTQTLITDGDKLALAKFPHIKVIFEESGNWNAEDAAKLTENWLSSGKPLDAIDCNNDGMALGVLAVLKNSGRIGKVKLYGLDATPEAVRAIKAGEMNASIFIDSMAEAKLAMKTLADLLGGRKVQKINIIEPVLVTRDNADKFIRAQN